MPPSTINGGGGDQLRTSSTNSLGALVKQQKSQFQRRGSSNHPFSTAINNNNNLNNQSTNYRSYNKSDVVELDEIASGDEEQVNLLSAEKDNLNSNNLEPNSQEEANKIGESKGKEEGGITFEDNNYLRVHSAILKTVSSDDNNNEEEEKRNVLKLEIP